MKSTAASFTAFHGQHRLACGSLADVAAVVRQALAESSDAAILVFDDANGAVVDLDVRGSEQDVRARYAAPPNCESSDSQSEEIVSTRGRGRPRLGVMPREVTLLPRHWEWLATQPSGASATLRRLVEQARRSSQAVDAARASREAAYRFMAAMGGDLPGFEEAARALFAKDQRKLALHIAAWPADLKSYVRFLTGEAEPNEAR
jgi:hypothetical protein